MTTQTVHVKAAEIPSDTQLVLLCLDYLRDLRRNSDESTLRGKQNLDADYISLAVYALSRSILRPDYLSNKSPAESIFERAGESSSSHKIPHISKINQEIFAPKEDNLRPYDMDYNDLSPSNLYRFYKLRGLGSGPENGPLVLGQLVAFGLKSTDGRCRLEAEKDIIKNPQFDRYIQSVTARGYFNDAENSGKRKNPKEEEERRARKAQVYKDKYRKAIAKYREKLADSIRKGNKTSILLHSPPNSPPGVTLVSRNTSSFHSPPRSLTSSKGSSPPMSPLTPNTVVVAEPEPTKITSAPSPPRPKSLKSLRTKKTNSNSISKSSSSSTTGRPTASSISNQEKPDDASPKAPVKSDSSTSTKNGSKAPNKSPLDSVNRERLRARKKTGSAPKQSDQQKKPMQNEQQKLQDDSTKVTDPSGSASLDSYEAPKTEISVKPNQIKALYPKPPIEKQKNRSFSPVIEMKVKAFSLYEMNLVNSASSGLEANAGSFASLSPEHQKQQQQQHQRRKKSDYEKKLEEKQRWNCPTSLAIPDISDPTRKTDRKPVQIRTMNTSIEDRVPAKAPKTPTNSTKEKRKLFDKDCQSFSPVCTSPVARMRHDKKSDELNRLRGFGEESFQSTSVTSPRRVKKQLPTRDTSWISSQPHSPSDDDTKENDGKPYALKRSAFAAASKKIGTAGSVGNGSKASVGRMPTNSPKAEIKLDPFKLNPPKIFNKLGAGASRLYTANAGECDATQTTPLTSNVASRRISSPRGLRKSPRAFHNSPRNIHNKNNIHGFDPSPLKRAC